MPKNRIENSRPKPKKYFMILSPYVVVPFIISVLSLLFLHLPFFKPTLYDWQKYENFGLERNGVRMGGLIQLLQQHQFEDGTSIHLSNRKTIVPAFGLNTYSITAELANGDLELSFHLQLDGWGESRDIRLFCDEKKGSALCCPEKPKERRSTSKGTCFVNKLLNGYKVSLSDDMVKKSIHRFSSKTLGDLLAQFNTHAESNGYTLTGTYKVLDYYEVRYHKGKDEYSLRIIPMENTFYIETYITPDGQRSKIINHFDSIQQLFSTDLMVQ